VDYLHRACFSSIKSTWLKAISAGYFSTWPGLTASLVIKHLQKLVATAQGHLRQEPQNLGTRLNTKTTEFSQIPANSNESSRGPRLKRNSTEAS
jgi:hypothetical protein